MAEKPPAEPDHVAEYGKGGMPPPRPTGVSTPARSTAITRRSGRCCRRSCKDAPATCWRSAAAPASTRSNSRGNRRRSPGGRATISTATCAASRPGAPTRSSATCRRRRSSMRARRTGGSPSAACRTEFLAMFCANVIHIAPWAVAQGLFAGAGRHLRADGRLFLYGPFRRDGVHNAPSNAAFDAKPARATIRTGACATPPICARWPQRTGCGSPKSSRCRRTTRCWRSSERREPIHVMRGLDPSHPNYGTHSGST